MKKSSCDWFDLGKYDFVDSLSDREFIFELMIRAFVWDYANYCRKTGFFEGEYESLPHSLWVNIQKKPYVAKIDEDTTAHLWAKFVDANKRNYAHEDKILSQSIFESTAAVEPLSIDTLAYLTAKVYGHDSIVENKLTPESPWAYGETEGDLSVYSSVSSAGSIDSDLVWKMVISLDLERDDDSIMDDIAKLLPLWRDRKKSLGLCSGVPVKSKPKTLKRLRDYKILPLLDLMNWQAIEKVKVPFDVLEQMLFPKGFDGTGLEGWRAIQTTVKPWADKCTSQTFLRSLLKNTEE